jgi:hypothetical protein
MKSPIVLQRLEDAKGKTVREVTQGGGCVLLAFTDDTVLDVGLDCNEDGDTSIEVRTYKLDLYQLKLLGFITQEEWEIESARRREHEEALQEKRDRAHYEILKARFEP